VKDPTNENVKMEQNSFSTNFLSQRQGEFVHPEYPEYEVEEKSLRTQDSEVKQHEMINTNR
jgi:hypothetical protein